MFLSKQSPMGRDLIARPYGRFFYIPMNLVKLGHEVHIILLCYKSSPTKTYYQHGIHWHSVSIYKYLGVSYFLLTYKLAKQIKPDWIIGFSDTYYGILATWLARLCKTKSLIDAYDNYESYLPKLKPLHWLWRHAIKSADTVTAAGPGLAQYMEQFRNNGRVEIMPMAADPDFNALLDKTECRSELGLPRDTKLVGYCGSISKNRGINTLLTAFTDLKKTNPGIKLVLSGRLDSSVTLPDFVIWLGYLPDDQLPKLIKSLDLVVAVNIPTKFGLHSYPVKIYEAIQSDTNVVATRTPATEWILQDHPELLFEPNDVDDLINKIKHSVPRVMHYEKKYSWEIICKDFENILKN